MISSRKIQVYKIVCLIIFVNVFIACQQNPQSNNATVVEQNDVTQNEKLHPETFLKMKGSQHPSGPKQFLSDIKIINSASKVGYTNIFIRIHMLDDQNNIVDSSSNIVYSKIAAGDSVSFKLKTKLTKGTHIKMRIEKADTF